MPLKSPGILLMIVLTVAALLLSGCAPAPSTPPPAPPTVTDTATPLPTQSPSQTLPPTPLPSPSPVPPAQWIAYVGVSADGNPTLRLVSQDGSQSREPFPGLNYSSNRHRWSPDGRWLAFVYADSPSSAVIKLYDPLSAQEINTPAIAERLVNGSFAWSPDSSALAYVASQGDTCQVEIFTLSDAALRSLQSFACSPTLETMVRGWTADGRYLLVDVNTHGDIDDPRDLSILDVAADRRVALLVGLGWYTALTSPDNASLAVGSSLGVQIVDLGSGQVQNMTEEVFKAGEARSDYFVLLTWLADGRLLYAREKTGPGNVPFYWYLFPAEDGRSEPAEDAETQLPLVRYADVFSHQLHGFYYNSQVQAQPVNPRTIQARLPSGLQLEQFEISADQSQVLLSADNQIYRLDWASGDLMGPLAAGRWPRGQPDGSQVSQPMAVFTGSGSPTPQPSPTPVAPLLDSARLFSWDAWVSYDPAAWELITAKETVGLELRHRSLAGCELVEQGPTEPPAATQTLDIGPVRYKIAENYYRGQHADWYMALRTPSGQPFLYGTPTLVLRGAVNQDWPACMADALHVLETMTDVQPDTSGSGSGFPPGFTCDGALAPRLTAGEYAYVSLNPPLANRVRSGPGTSYAILGTIEPGQVIQVVGGPQCADQWVWWEVMTLDSRLVGWTAEGDSPTYWLIPCGSAGACAP